MKNFIKKGTKGTIVKTPRIIYCLEKMMSFSVDSFMEEKICFDRLADAAQVAKVNAKGLQKLI